MNPKPGPRQAKRRSPSPARGSRLAQGPTGAGPSRARGSNPFQQRPQDEPPLDLRTQVHFVEDVVLTEDEPDEYPHFEDVYSETRPQRQSRDGGRPSVPTGRRLTQRENEPGERQ